MARRSARASTRISSENIYERICAAAASRLLAGRQDKDAAWTLFDDLAWHLRQGRLPGRHTRAWAVKAVQRIDKGIDPKEAFGLGGRGWAAGRIGMKSQQAAARFYLLRRQGYSFRRAGKAVREEFCIGGDQLRICYRRHRDFRRLPTQGLLAVLSYPDE